VFGEQERVTVRELMTADPERVSAGASVGDVHEWLTEKGYTATPVARDDPPHLYVTRADLADALPGATDEPVHRHAERVRIWSHPTPSSANSSPNWRSDRSTSSAGTATSSASSRARI
jgi:predicted transcriptional regulator